MIVAEIIYRESVNLSISQSQEILDFIGFLKNHHIDKSTVEHQSSIPSFNKGAPQRLIAALKAHPLPSSAKLSDEEIENQILELARNWE